MKRNKFAVVGIFSICLMGLLIFIIGCSFTRPSIKNNIKYWETGDYSKLPYGESLSSLLPSFEKDNLYVDANFYYHTGCVSFDYAEAAYCLQLDLCESEYNYSKKNLSNDYNFLEDIVLKNEIIMLTDYKIGDFEIRVIDNGNSNFPHEIEFIALNDFNNRIRYCYIVSMSLDYIANEGDFINWVTSNLNIDW